MRSQVLGIKRRKFDFDPNPRLEALIDAARRGAQVRLLLDSPFDDAEALRANCAIVESVNTIAATEWLALEARTGNPTGWGYACEVCPD